MPKEVVTSGGIIIPIEQGAGYAGVKNYQMQKYAPTHGEVVSVGDKTNGILVGDVVMFHFTTEETCKQQGRTEYDGDAKLFYIESEKVVCILRDGVLKPADGWLIARRAEKAKDVTDGGIILTNVVESDTKFVVLTTHDGYEDCKEGDIIYTEIHCDRPIDSNEYFGITDKDLFKIETKDIVAVQR
mgnify:CR=1 FL=1